MNVSCCCGNTGQGSTETWILMDGNFSFLLSQHVLTGPPSEVESQRRLSSSHTSGVCGLYCCWWWLTLPASFYQKPNPEVKAGPFIQVLSEHVSPAATDSLSLSLFKLLLMKSKLWFKGAVWWFLYFHLSVSVCLCLNVWMSDCLTVCQSVDTFVTTIASQLWKIQSKT